MKELPPQTPPNMDVLDISVSIRKADPGENWRIGNRLAEMGLLPALSSLLDLNDLDVRPETALLRLTKISPAGIYTYLMVRGKRLPSRLIYAAMALESSNSSRLETLKTPSKLPIRETLKFHDLFALRYFEPSDAAHVIHKVFNDLKSIAGLDKWESDAGDQKQVDPLVELEETDIHAGSARHKDIDSVLEFCSRSYGNFRLKWHGRASERLTRFESLFFRGLFEMIANFR